MDGPQSSDATTEDDGTSSVERAPLEGRPIAGRYFIVSLLGVGGSGRVYRAYDSKLCREVALKVLHVDATRDGDATFAQRRLMAEAQALARLSHPNVVAVYDVAEEGADVFVAMELVDGESLRVWQQGARSKAEILRAYAAAGEGLAAAHATGLLHRDFKPDNVMVGKDGRVRVLDFGLAKAMTGGDGDADAAVRGDGATVSRPAPPLDGATSPAATLARTASAAAGTPRYMAPEQWLRLPLSQLTDQYAFCVAAYEALVGAHPLLQEGAVDERGPVPVQAPKDLRHGDRVLRALRRGLSAKPEDRFPSMDALLAELAPPARRAPVGLALVALLVLGVGVFAAARGARVDPCENAAESFRGIWDGPRRAALEGAFRRAGGEPGGALFALFDKSVDGHVARWSHMHREVCLATRVRGVQSEAMMEHRMACLRSRLRELGAFLQKASEVAAPADLPPALDRSFALTPLDACADDESLARGATFKGTAEERARAEEVRAAADALQGQMFGARGEEVARAAEDLLAKATALGDRELVARARLQLGQALGHAGRRREALATLQEAMGEAASVKDDGALAQAYVTTMDNLVPLGDYAAALTLEPVTRAAILRAGGSADNENGVDRLVAWALQDLGRVGEAKERLERALQSAEQHGLRPDRKGLTLDGYATVLQELGLLAEAERASREALRILEEAEGPHHPDVAIALTNLGETLHRLGRFDEAVPILMRAIDIDETFVAHDNPARAYPMLNLAACLLNMRRPAEARAKATEARAIFAAAVGPNHVSAAIAAETEAAAALQLGDASAALASFDEAIATYGRAVGPENALAARSHQGRALALLALDRRDQALTSVELALSLTKRSTQSPGDLAAAELAYARVLDAQKGKRSEARRWALSAQSRLAASDAARLPLTGEVGAWLAAHPGSP